MTPEQIEDARLAEEAKIAAELAADPLTKLQEENARLSEERDNYKNVALKRLGKLPGDAEFLSQNDDTEFSVAEQVKIQLLEREVSKNKEAEKIEIDRMRRENAELRLAIKNRPGSSIGSDSGSSSKTKDNVFSAAQLEVLRNKALRLKADPEKFIQAAKNNLSKRS